MQKSIKLLLIIILTVFIPLTASTQHKINRSVFGNGGYGKSLYNSRYNLSSTIGQTGIGKSNSSSTIYKLGFWYLPKVIVGVFDYPGNNVDDNEMTFLNYPNPFIEQTTIKIFIKEEGKYSISLYDNFGEKVFDPYYQQFHFGINDFKIYTEKLLSGVYSLCISSDKVLLTKQITCLK